MVGEKEKIHSIKTLKKYESLSEHEKNKVKDSTIGLAAGILAIVGGAISEYEIMYIITIIGSVFSTLHLKRMIESLFRKAGYDLKIEELRDQLEEWKIELEEKSKGSR